MKNKKTMKNRIVLALLLANFLFLGSYVFASFPVKTAVKTSTGSEQTLTKQEQAITQVESLKKSETLDAAKAPQKDDDMLITLLLWFFLGGLAAHRWYKKKPVGWNILFILTAGGCGVWAIVDLVNIITGKF